MKSERGSCIKFIPANFLVEKHFLKNLTIMLTNRKISILVASQVERDSRILYKYGAVLQQYTSRISAAGIRIESYDLGFLCCVPYVHVHHQIQVLRTNDRWFVSIDQMSFTWGSSKGWLESYVYVCNGRLYCVSTKLKTGLDHFYIQKSNC
jgi:hypothetical protein